MTDHLCSTFDPACYRCDLARDEVEHDVWPAVPNPIPADPYDEDGYCDYCGNGSWKYHSPDCKWADAVEASGGSSTPPNVRPH